MIWLSHQILLSYGEQHFKKKKMTKITLQGKLLN